MSYDLNALTNLFFAFNQPVPYKLKCNYELLISPIKLQDSPIFLSSYDILDIDKNNTSEVEVIQMSYLQFLAERICTEQNNAQKLLNICVLNLGFNYPFLRKNEKGKYVLSDIKFNDIHQPLENFFVTSKEFEEIKRIVLYQNLINYNDDYIDPELKANMAEMEKLKMHGYEMPDFERRMSIITAHTGLTRNDQLNMTLREHSMLFVEVCGEVDYVAQKAIGIYGGHGDDVQWIKQKAKSKYDDYVTSVEHYSKSMGTNINKKIVR